MAKAGNRKYQPLAEYLAAQPGDAVTLSFAQIEAIIGVPLPASASAYLPVWWTTRSAHRVQTQARRQVGWEAAAVTRRERAWRQC